MSAKAAAPGTSAAGTDLCLPVGLKDVKTRGTALKVVGDEDSYAVSPRAPLLTTDLQNNAFLCGEARFGQLGSGVRPISHHRPVPTPQPQSVAGDNSWAFISLGSFHAAAITSQGKLYTWGLNSQGQCGVVEPDPAERGRVTYYPGPARVKSSTTGGTYKAVACGGEHTVALGSRGVCAWGSNKRGQLGLGAGAPQTVWRPLLLPSLARTSVTQLVCGAHHTLALTAQSQVLAWGANERGQLGVGDTSDRHTPTQVEGLWGLPITRLAAGDCHSLALTNTGQLFAWGSNSHGQCGVIIEEEPETPETPAPPPEPLPSPPRPSPPPQRPEDKLHQAWKEAMANMGIEPDVVELSLSHTGWRGVELAVEWLFSQDEKDLKRHLERWRAAHAPLRQASAAPPSPTPARTTAAAVAGPAARAPGAPLTVVEGSGAADSGAARSRLSRLTRAGGADAAQDAASASGDGAAGAGAAEQDDEEQELVWCAPVEVQLAGVKHMAAGMCFSVAVLENGEVYSFGLGGWGALGHGDLQDRELPTRVMQLEGVVVERVTCGQYHTIFMARDGTVYGSGRCEAGQLGHVIAHGADHREPHIIGPSNASIISRPVRLQLTSSLLEELSAVNSTGGQGSPFQECSPAGNGSSNSCSDGASDTDCGAEDAHGGRVAAPGFKVRTTAGTGGAGRMAPARRAGVVDETSDPSRTSPSPTKTILYDAPQRSPQMGAGVVLHEVVAGGCNTAILLRKEQETPSPWQVTLLAKLQAAVARALNLQNSGGPSTQLALALRNVARGASLVLSSPAALCAAFAIRAPRTPSTPLDPSKTPLAASLGNLFGGASASFLGGSPRHKPKGGNPVFGSASSSAEGLGGVYTQRSIPPTPQAAAAQASAQVPQPLPLPLDITLLDQLYCSLLELSGVSKEPAALGSLTDYDQGPAMCELQRYGLQQALLRCGLTLCEDLMVHAPLLRAPERAQVLLAALHNPLLSDPACCKQLLPKLCHAVLAAPAAARRLLVRWWASYPPDLLNERLIQPMQAFITKELAAVKKLTSSIMAVIKVLARVEAANQLAGGPLPPECFYNTLISEKMDVQDHYSAWRTTQDLGGGLPGVRPVTNTSGAQAYACELDSEPEMGSSSSGNNLTRSRSAVVSLPVARSSSLPSSTRTTTPSGPAPTLQSPSGGAAGAAAPAAAAAQPPPTPGDRPASPDGDARVSDTGSDLAGWDQQEQSAIELGGQGSMRMSDPGHRTASTVALPPLVLNQGSQGPSVPPARRTITGGTHELTQRGSGFNPQGAGAAEPSPSGAASAAPAPSRSAFADAALALPPLPPPAPSGGRSRGARTSRDGAEEVVPRRASVTGATRTSDPGSPVSRSQSHGPRSSYTRPPEWQDADLADPANPAPAPPPAPPPPRPAAEPGPFSFCTYPFLLDARAKSNLLHIEARFQMEQTVAHARMEQQLYGQQHARFGSRSESGATRGGRGGRGDPGSASCNGTPNEEDAIMLHVLDKASLLEEDEDEVASGSWGSSSPTPASAAAAAAAGIGAGPSGAAYGGGSVRGGVAGASGAGPSSSGTGAGPSTGSGVQRASSAGSGSGRNRTKGFRGLLAALLRHGVRGSNGTASPSAEAEDLAALMSDRRADSFKLPRPSECTMPGTHSDMCIIRVRRTHLVEDALDEITRQMRRDLFKPLRVHFIGEDGIDAGGVKKEFFALLLAELLRPEYGLMEINPETNTYWFPRYSQCRAYHYQLLGLVLGLAVYNRVLLDFPLPMVAYKKLLNMPVGLRDLTEMCPAIGSSLKQLLELEGPPGTVEDLLCLTWAVEGEAWGVRTTTELVPNGEQIPVTEENRQAYVDSLVNFYLYDSMKWQFEAFAKGFGVMCNGPALRLFNAQELERLVCGNPMLDWAALQRNAKYEGGYTASSPVVVWLWDVVRNELPLEEKKRFLKFFTGSDRAPIGGLGTLRCLIQRAGPDSSRLPTSHTCFNTLLLPEYQTRVRLAKQLRLAINNAEGFGLE